MRSENPAVPVMRDAAYFDQWYADMAPVGAAGTASRSPNVPAHAWSE